MPFGVVASDQNATGKEIVDLGLTGLTDLLLDRSVDAPIGAAPGGAF